MSSPPGPPDGWPPDEGPDHRDWPPAPDPTTPGQPDWYPPADAPTYEAPPPYGGPAGPWSPGADAAAGAGGSEPYGGGYGTGGYGAEGYGTGGYGAEGYGPGASGPGGPGGGWSPGTGYGAPGSGYGVPGGWPYGGYAVEHPKGSTVLVLGILSIVTCQLIGPFAWSMANTVLREIDQNPYAYNNRGSVQAGRVCAVIGTAILGFYLVLILGFGLLPLMLAGGA